MKPHSLKAQLASGLWVAVLLLLADRAPAQSPFTVTPSITGVPGSAEMRILFGMPANHHLYAGKISVHWDGDEKPLAVAMPEPKMIQDKFSKEQKPAFSGSFAAAFPLSLSWETNRNLLVRFQGCDESQCYFPETRTFAISPTGLIQDLTPVAETTPGSVVAGLGWKQMAERFEIVGRNSGYASAAGLRAFLDRSISGEQAAHDATGSLARWGWLAMVGLILLGGVGLNFTPCVLPLIPINLSIIGARGQNSTRRRGFALGAAYGLGMTAAYGLLGAVVVLTGSRFGTLNSSPWFNLVIAAVFAVLALGMFDRLSIDFSRFLRRNSAIQPGARQQGPYLLALTLGSVAALLAGACVAPVVISVMVLAADYYARGNALGLLLPFCLGLGMALPWPALGAGLALLPKPGVWMTRVKYGFGMVIALLALYYGHLSVSLFQNVPVLARELNSNPTQALQEALSRAEADGKPVFVDFWASWCKNCSAMEHSTFKDAQVISGLEAFHVVKFQAEHPDAMPARAVLDHFGVLGLPTCVVLRPKTAPMISPPQAP